MWYNVKVTVELMVEGKDHEEAALNARNVVSFAISKAHGWVFIDKVEVIHEVVEDGGLTNWKKVPK